MKKLGLCLVVFFALFSPCANAGDLQDIKARGEIRHLGFPYANFVTGFGDGFDVEIIQGFAKYLGVKYVFVSSQHSTLVRDLLGKDIVRKKDGGVLEGNYPVKGDLISVGFAIFSWREPFFLYSAPTFPSQVFLIARANAPLAPIKGSDNLNKDIVETKALIGKSSLMVVKNTKLDPRNYDLENKVANFHRLDEDTNSRSIARSLVDGKADLTLLDAPDVILDLHDWAGKIKVLGPISQEQALATAFSPSSPELRDAFNNYLFQIKANGMYDLLVDKYFLGIRSFFPEFFLKKD
ncbi:MAG: transporter substrate-binding domain-containing protein [Bdellovibrionales bacterium]|jgi:ABC-type amino acid transport substrate-binding protein